MEKILLPIRGKITPKEVLEEIKNFEYINKSPYSSSYYNTPDVTWEHKPEGSLRISDHWNFTTHGNKHCILENTEQYIDNNWILAKYIEGKYHILKEFGENVHGYRFKEVSRNEIELIKTLYNMGTIINSKEWYKKYSIRPILARETHMKSRKVLSKTINKERLKAFKSKNKSVKKVIYIQDRDIEIIKKVLDVYEKSSAFEELCKTEEGLNELINTYNAYEFKEDNKIESFKEIIILVLDNKMAIDFNICHEDI